MKILRWMSGVTRRVKIQNEYVRGILSMRATLPIKYKRVGCDGYGHIKRRPPDYIGNLRLLLSILGLRSRARSKTRWEDVMLRDIRRVSGF